MNTSATPASSAAVSSVAAPSVSSGRNGLLLFAAFLAILLVLPFFGGYPLFLMKVLCFALFACAFNLLIGFVGLLAAGALIALAAQLKNPVFAMLALGTSGFFNDLSMPGAWGACMDIGGKLAGSVSGSMNMVGNLGGALGGVAVPWLMKSMGLGWDGVLYVAAGTYLVSAVCWLFIDSDERLHA